MDTLLKFDLVATSLFHETVEIAKILGRACPNAENKGTRRSPQSSRVISVTEPLLHKPR